MVIIYNQYFLFVQKKRDRPPAEITKINVTSLVLGVTPRNFARWQVVGVAFDLHDQNVYIVNINVYRSNKPLFQLVSLYTL